MTYAEALTFLFDQLPMYQRVGLSAFKKDLDNTLRLCKYLGHPEQQFRSVHIAGTNGKGSSAHMIAAALIAAGHKTGLYTSPHLKDFCERIRIDGRPISQQAVVNFVLNYQNYLSELKPSFFEMSVGLAFEQFAETKVDIAVVEVGLGGRLDSTNVIIPEASLITNIGYDHTDMLGETLPEIAAEKAGIIKAGVPVVIGDYNPETLPVFEQKAASENSEIILAQQKYRIEKKESTEQHQQIAVYENGALRFDDLKLSLTGSYQLWNLPGVLATIERLNEQGFAISDDNIREGLESVQKLTGLKGRWQQIGENPTIIADTGHNIEAFQEIINQISSYQYQNLHLVLGKVQGKAIDKILSLFPKDAYFYFCKPAVPRGMNVAEIAETADNNGLNYQTTPSVKDALRQALAKAQKNDFIFVGGSTFVVAELDQI